MPEKPLLTGFMAYVKRPQSYAESINCNKINDLQSFLKFSGKKYS